MFAIGLAEAYRVSVGWAPPTSEGFNKLKEEYEPGVPLLSLCECILPAHSCSLKAAQGSATFLSYKGSESTAPVELVTCLQSYVSDLSYLPISPSA